MKKQKLHVLCLILFCCSCIEGAIVNGSFEIPDPNETPWFVPPAHWIRDHNNSIGDCYAGLHESFQPDPEYGQRVNWSIPAPFEGSQFVVLSTGDLGLNSDRQIEKSQIKQKVHFHSGDVVKGRYFFGTCDYFSYNDFAKIYLRATDPCRDPNEIELVFMNVETIGNYSSSEEWIPFVYEFTPQTEGEYEVICLVSDEGDRIYKSYLAVDGLYVCKSFANQADINSDCIVDLQDAAILSRAWLSQWYDPNDPVFPPPPEYVPDPNIPAEIADLNQDRIVDAIDLLILTDTWLENGLQPSF